MKSLADKRQKKVLAVIPGNAGGASMIFVKRQARALNDSGFECREFYLASRTSLWGVAKEWRRLRREIASYEPHLVHAHYGTVTSLVAVLSTTCPVVVHLRGSDVLALRITPRTMLAHLMTQISLLKASQIICVAEHLKNALWWRKHIVSIIPTGVDLRQFVPGNRLSARAELGWQMDQPTVIFNASRDPSIKRLDLAQAVVERANQKIPDIRFEVLDGFQDPDRIPVMLQAADCLLLTSQYEGSPNVVKEAMACGLPVVSVDVGDVYKRLEGVQPSLVAGPDVDSLAEGLVAILQEKGVRSNGREKLDSIGLDKVTEMVAEVYQKAMPC
jgi:teichuronic acid biosynthesis glycosyltransferase TuaC